MDLTLDVARLMPMHASAGASDAAVLQALPPQGLTAAQARHALLLLELEQLLGVEAGADGHIADPRMASLSMRNMVYREELSAAGLQQQVAAAVLQDEPEVATRYYAPEDALVVALCALVPASRVSRSRWESPLCSHLGFAQWLGARAAAKQAVDGDEDEEAQGGGQELQEETAGLEDGERGQGEGDGDGGGEGEGEAPPKKRKEYKMPQLPLPEKVDRVYDMDAACAALLDDQQTMVLVGGPKIIAGSTRAGDYIRWHTDSHSVHMRQQPPTASGAGGWAVSVTYHDGACLMLRAGVASFSTAEGVHVTLDANEHSDGIVWRSVPHARAGGTRAPLSWTAATDSGVILVDAPPAPPPTEGEEPAEEDAAAEPRKMVVLPQGAPADATPSAAEATMVLPASAGGAQVVRKADGTARVLLPDSSVGWYGGEARGWEWTNAKGLRQGKVPQFVGQPQHRDGIASAIESDPASGSITRFREDGVYSYERHSPQAGVEHLTVRFADGSVSSIAPGGQTTTVVREGLGQVRVGPSARESTVQLEDGSTLSVDAAGMLRVVRRGDCAELVYDIGSARVHLYSAGRASQDVQDSAGAPPAGGSEATPKDLMSQLVRAAGAGYFLMDLSQGQLRTVDAAQHLYMVTDGKAEVVLAGQAVPAPAEAPGGPADGADAGSEAGTADDSGAGREVLEALRVFVMRRNGTGYELLSAGAAEAAMVRARRAGELVLEETRGHEDNDVVVCTMVAEDDRGWVPEPEVQARLGANLRAVSQRPTGGRGGGGVRWRQLVREKPMDEQTMAGLRKAVKEALDGVIESDSPPVMGSSDSSDFARQVTASLLLHACTRTSAHTRTFTRCLCCACAHARAYTHAHACISVSTSIFI